MQYAVTTNGGAIYELGSRKCLCETLMDRKDTFDILSYSEKKDMFPFLFIDGRGMPTRLLCQMMKTVLLLY